MSTQSRRGTPRSRVRRNDSAGRFLLKTPARSFIFHTVENVSISGTGLTLPEPVAVGTPVTLCYYHGGATELQTQGTVAWCDTVSTGSAPLSPPGYRAGIAFRPDQIKNNILFFMALRQYADPFTWSHHRTEIVDY